MPEYPYLESHDRLGEVITAIQLLATYRWYRRTAAEISEVVGEPKGVGWDVVLAKHPEFFIEGRSKKTTATKWALNMRNAQDLNWLKSESREVTLEEAGRLKGSAQHELLSKRPLETDAIAILINSAISLHESERWHAERRQWLWQIAVPAVVALAVALITVTLGS